MPQVITKFQQQVQDLINGNIRQYRSVVMKMNYIAMDRPGLQWSVRRCAKAMSSPKESDRTRLKRIAMYLRKKWRLL